MKSCHIYQKAKILQFCARNQGNKNSSISGWKWNDLEKFHFNTKNAEQGSHQFSLEMAKSWSKIFLWTSSWSQVEIRLGTSSSIQKKIWLDSKGRFLQKHLAPCTTSCLHYNVLLNHFIYFTSTQWQLSRSNENAKLEHLCTSIYLPNELEIIQSPKTLSPNSKHSVFHFEKAPKPHQGSGFWKTRQNAMKSIIYKNVANWCQICTVYKKRLNNSNIPCFLKTGKVSSKSSTC